MSEFNEGLAEILEVESAEIVPEHELGSAWDSLAIVSTIALIDEVYDLAVGVQDLEDCRTVGDIQRLVEAQGA